MELSEEQDPAVFFSFGMCYTCFANYFKDVDFYYQAIEHFQYGLAIDRRLASHWNAIGNLYLTIGELTDDLDAYEKAAKFLQRADHLKSAISYSVDYAIALTKLGELTENENLLQEACSRFEMGLQVQKNALYVRPDWLFYCAIAHDQLGNFHEEDTYYLKALEFFSHVLMVDPDFPHLHHRIGLTFSHFGDLHSDLDHFYRAIHHFKLASKHEEEDDALLMDWGVALINIAEHVHDPQEKELFYREAENKLALAAKLGNEQVCYHFACLYSLQGLCEQAMKFIEKAHAHRSLPPIENVLDDEWLDAVRATPQFHDFFTAFY